MPENPNPLTRRRFIAESAAFAAGSVVMAQIGPLLNAQGAAAPAPFRSGWGSAPDRVWLGQQYWSNPLQDWEIAAGRIECNHAAPDRNVHLLVRDLGTARGTFFTTVRLGRAEGGLLAGAGSAGFRVGVQGPLREYRNNLIFGQGLDAGITGAGGLFIGDARRSSPGAVGLEREEIELRLSAEPVGDAYRVTLSAHDGSGSELGTVSADVAAEQLVGNVALVNNFGESSGRGDDFGLGLGRFWFADWSVGGSKVQEHAERVFGPIHFSQYTLSQGVMKMTAQMPPLGPDDSPTVRLELRQGRRWRTVGEEAIHPESRTAAFRVENWNSGRDVPYRLIYALHSKDGRTEDHLWTGTVRRDPIGEAELSVADVSCNIHAAFPNHSYVASMARLDPDLLAFTGDQFYESSGGYGIIREPTDRAMIDYLRKWYLHGWTWRNLMRDRPSISLPDDHDVYQGNIWGEGGEGRKTTQAAGGYDMPVSWVNVVYRTQTAHHPDPYDPTPGERGTIEYFGPFTYGRVSFAVLADRQHKSGPEGKVPKTEGRGDHVLDPEFDPQTADRPGLELLGETQEQFLREWVTDWRGADMKAVISQTLFTSLPTTHGRDRSLLRADYDSNGWPQTPRNRAVREIRKAFAFHLAGDQHLPAVVQYGVDEHGDGPVAFAGPAVNVGYPRWWEPARAPWTQPRQESGLLGDFTDSFGHPMRVLAVRNGAEDPDSGDLLKFLNEKASGIGLVRFDKRKRRVVVECWPYISNPAAGTSQFPNWPVVIDLMDNYARRAQAHLPTLRIAGLKNPVVQVIEEATGELVYALRLASQEFRPHVFAPGRYTVRVGDPDLGKSSEITGLEAAPENRSVLRVKV